MAAGYDIGVSASESQGIQTGAVSNGDFVVGGSGGASTGGIPTSVIVGIIALAVLGVFVWFIGKK